MKKLLLALLAGLLVSCATIPANADLNNQPDALPSPSPVVLVTTSGSTPVQLSASPDGDDKLIVIPKDKQVKVEVDNDRTLFLFDEVNDEMVTDVMDKMIEYDKAPEKPVYVIIKSSGGSIDAGLRIENVLDGAKSKTICIVDQMAYSMAAGIFLHCDQKLMSPGSDLMYHEGSTGVRGDKNVVLQRLLHSLKSMDEMDIDNAKHLHMTLKDYKAKVKNEWWLTNAEAVDLKIADGLAIGLKYHYEPPPQNPLQLLFR